VREKNLESRGYRQRIIYIKGGKSEKGGKLGIGLG